jgi:hypothetical protein
MITIGIRAAPKAVTFAIYDSDAKTIINIEEIKIPAAFSSPDGLKYLRNNLLDVLREFKVEKAGVRASEPSARNPSIERIQIEGVIQEAFASSYVSYNGIRLWSKIAKPSASVDLRERQNDEERNSSPAA